MKPQPTIQDREIVMIQFQKVLQGPIPLVRAGLNVVDLNRRYLDCLCGV